MSTDNEKYFANKYRIASARLQNWDYGTNAAYFVTICTKNREHYFGEIEECKNARSCISTIQLSEIGLLANKFWLEIPQHFPFVKLGAFVVMPNHVHGIIIIDKPDGNSANVSVETLHATSLRSTSPIIEKKEKMASISPKSGALSTIIRSCKSVVTKHARQIHADFAWQSRYYDHIIRNDKSFQTITDYIGNNMLKWSNDKFNTDTQ